MLVPRLRALRVASPTPYRGQHRRPGKAGSAVFHDQDRTETVTRIQEGAFHEV